jgi:type IV pilus assembly protein PilW
MNRPSSLPPARSARRMRGMSLVELMVSITIGLGILAGVVVIFSNTSAARNEVERTSRQIENGRYAIELLTDDLRLAGFLGEFNIGPMPTPASLPDPCSSDIAEWESALPLHLQGYDMGAGAPSCIGGGVKPNTDIVVVRRVRACAAGEGGCPAAAASMPYLQVSQCASEITSEPYKYVLGVQGGATYGLTRKDCSTTARVRQYLVHLYFIATDNHAGQNIPTLKRVARGAGGWEVEPLVEGIEHLNVVYGIDYKNAAGVAYAADDGDGKRDGVADAYTSDPTTFSAADCPPASCTPQQNWRNVMTVQLFLVARNIDASPGYKDTKVYHIGTDAAGNPVSVGPYNDAYRRHVYTTVVRIANPAGRRDTP